jgi:Uma2 family endonuclease
MTKPIENSELLTVTTAPQEAKPLIWTLDRYHQAIDHGILTTEDKVELLFGQLIPKMHTGEPHAECLSQLFELFYDRFGKTYKYRAQDPVTLPHHSEPEPDFVIAERKVYNKQTGHPGPDDVHLLIELSSRTLRYDRGDKLRAYAFAGIKEYWIINLEHRQVEVHLQPNEEVGDYALTAIYRSGQTFESPFGGTYTVDELLPATEPAVP